MKLPTDDTERAKYPLDDYDNFFPNARREKARHAYESNVKHCGEGKPIKWASDKSVGDGNQIKRHLDDFSSALRDRDREEAIYHLRANSWRADELLERLLTNMPPFDKIEWKKDERPTKEDLPLPYERISEYKWRILDDGFLQYLHKNSAAPIAERHIECGKSYLQYLYSQYLASKQKDDQSQ